jgi:uncharacterized membrane protein
MAALVLFGSSSLRHHIFATSALDLGFFDQAVYLISRGQPPIISFSGFHLLGDHAAFVYYPLALLYRIYPDVHWLFAVQAIALAIGFLPVWLLSKQARLSDAQAQAMGWVYLLYPLVFNIGLFDFHSEVLALPAFFWAVWAARSRRPWQFALALALILMSKAVLSLTVAAMGFWLLVIEKKRSWGIAALIAGVAWFGISTQIIIPYFKGGEAAAVGRYQYLGNSVLEMALNLFLRPDLILSHLFTRDNFEYLLYLALPVLWGLAPRALSPLIAAIPALGLNLLTDYQPQKTLIYQYSLPILPFLILAVLAALVAGKSWLSRPRWIILWSLAGFIAFAKFGYFTSNYLQARETWSAMRTAIALVPAQGSVLTSPQIAPHLTHRPQMELAIKAKEPFNLEKYDTILLNTRNAAWEDSQQTVTNLAASLRQSPQFKLQFDQEGVMLFHKNSPSRSAP